LNNPDNPLFDLLPPPCDAAIIERLRSAHLAVYSEDTYLQVPIIYTLWFNPLPAKVNMNHLSLSNNSYSFGNQNCVLCVVVIAVAITAFFSHRIH